MSVSVEKAKAIKLLILDVDGILTDGLIYYGTDGIELKGFHVHDGLGIKLLQKTGVIVAVISAKNSEPVARRLKDLAVTHAYLGHENKLPAYESLKQHLKLADHQIAYLGDDLPDLPLLKRVGLALSVPNAPLIIKQHVDMITNNMGGRGAVREACEFIMVAQESYQSVLQFYLQS